MFKKDDVPPPPPPTFAERIAKWFPQLDKAAVEKLSTYNDELLKFNKTISLISEQTVKKTDVVHFADSVLASQLIYANLILNAPLYDFGSGNGFPGLVFGILYPQTQLVLMEKDSKKAEFLKHIRSLLKLENVEVRTGELEELAENSVQNAMSRAYIPLNKLMLSSRKVIASGGKFFYLKSDSWPQELAGVPSQLFTVWNPSLLGQYSLPETGTSMAVVITQKI